MTSLVKFNNGSRTMPALSSWIEDWFGKDMPGSLFNDFTGISMPAVNIRETADNYEVEVAAPGMQKGDFNINLDNNLLTISSERQHEEKNVEEERFTRREFSYSSFRRTFTLPETVNAEKISAKYKDGILIIDLPKKDHAKKKPARTIKIS